MEESGESQVPVALVPSEHLSLVRDDGRRVGYALGGETNSPKRWIVWFVNLNVGSHAAFLHKELLAERDAGVVVVDRPNVGRTDLAAVGGDPEESCDPSAGDGDDAARLRRVLDVAADDVAAVLDEIRCDRAHVVGTCAGTSYAMRFAARHASRVRGRIALASPFLSPSDAPPRTYGIAVAARLPTWMVSGFFGAPVAMLSSLAESLSGSTDGLGARVIAKFTDQETDSLSDVERTRLARRWGRALKSAQPLVGEGDTATICLSPLTDDGSDAVFKDACVFLGIHDDVTSPEAARWLADRLGAQLKRVAQRPPKRDRSHVKPS